MLHHHHQPHHLQFSKNTMPGSETFYGDLDKSRGFLTQCALIFRQQTQAYATDRAKIMLMVELMTGRVLQWAQAVLNTQPLISYNDVLSKFWCVFDKAHRMLTLNQGWRSVADFSVDFWIFTELATEKLPKTLNALINMRLRLININILLHGLSCSYIVSF